MPSQFLFEGGEGAGADKSLIMVLYDYGIIGIIIHPFSSIKFLTYGSL